MLPFMKTLTMLPCNIQIIKRSPVNGGLNLTFDSHQKHLNEPQLIFNKHNEAKHPINYQKRN